MKNKNMLIIGVIIIGVIVLIVANQGGFQPPQQDSDRFPPLADTITQLSCEDSGGIWKECGNRCMILNQGTRDVVCPQLCESLCQCGGIQGLNCPQGSQCVTPSNIMDAIGYCGEIKTTEPVPLPQPIPNLCGGIAGVQCPSGFYCKLFDENIKDSQGKCFPIEIKGIVPISSEELCKQFGGIWRIGKCYTEKIIITYGFAPITQQQCVGLGGKWSRDRCVIEKIIYS